nr:hypothetical protein [Propionivibrio dicarboxylicus]
MASSAMGARAQSKATQAAYDYQSKVAANNAKIAEWQAENALERGQKAEQTSRLKTAQLKGTQRAALAEKGIALDEGSALNILNDTDYMGDVDANTIHDNAALEAWGYRAQAAGLSSDSSMLAARAAAEDPTAATTSSLLGSAGSVASSWYAYKTRTKVG